MSGDRLMIDSNIAIRFISGTLPYDAAYQVIENELDASIITEF